MSGGKFVAAVSLPVQKRPRMEQREVAKDAEEVLEVVNTYLPIPVTTFTASMMADPIYVSSDSSDPEDTL